jgi:hypothetical protein
MSGNMAEWSKAPESGRPISGPSGREFESPCCQQYMYIYALMFFGVLNCKPITNNNHFASILQLEDLLRSHSKVQC